MEAVNEYQNVPGNLKNKVGDYDDGRYFYTGTGSEESEDRVSKIEDKKDKMGNSKYREYIASRHGKESLQDRAKKEQGEFRSTGFLKNVGSIKALADGDKDVAKDFLKFLYSNGLSKGN